MATALQWTSLGTQQSSAFTTSMIRDAVSPLQYLPFVAFHGSEEIYFSLGPFYGAIAVPTVTRCRRRRRRRGHRCTGGVRRDSSDTWWMVMRRAAARSGEWAQLFQMFFCYTIRSPDRRKNVIIISHVALKTIMTSWSKVRWLHCPTQVVRVSSEDFPRVVKRHKSIKTTLECDCTRSATGPQCVGPVSDRRTEQP